MGNRNSKAIRLFKRIFKIENSRSATEGETMAIFSTVFGILASLAKMRKDVGETGEVAAFTNSLGFAPKRATERVKVALSLQLY